MWTTVNTKDFPHEQGGKTCITTAFSGVKYRDHGKMIHNRMKWITSVDWLECNVTNLSNVKNLSAFQCIVSRKSNTFEVGSLTYLSRCLGSFLGMVTVDHWWFSEEPCWNTFHLTRANSWWGEFNHENECLMSQTQTQARAEAKLHIAWGWIEQNDHVQKNGHYLGWTCDFVCEPCFVCFLVTFAVVHVFLCFLVICSHAQWVHFELSLEPKLFGKHMQQLCACCKKNPAHQHAFLRFKTAGKYIWPRWVAQTLNKFWWY
jgi:hypothetical protein